MPEEIPTPDASFIPQKSTPAQADTFVESVQGLLDGRPTDDATVTEELHGVDSMVDEIAADLYTLASMLVGEGEDSIGLVEIAVTRAEIDACSDPAQARRSGLVALSAAALELIAKRDPAALTAPSDVEPTVTCIEDEELDAASPEEADGPNREHVRAWLESLPTSLRTIYVLRAVAGFSSAETASLLSRHGGAAAAAWSPEAVRELFRQALCSLASQLLHAANSR